MSDTLRSLRNEIQLESRGDFSGSPDEDSIVNAAINDATETIWIAMMEVSLARFIGADSPVSFILPINTERVQLVTLADPTQATGNGQVAGGALGNRSYDYAYTYVTESGTETNLSPITLAAAFSANFLASINHPNQPTTGKPFGWNFYFRTNGSATGALVLQNQQPIPMGVNFIEPPVGFQDYPAFQQLPPLSNMTADNISWISHMEVRTSDTLLRAWNQVDIDSEIMRRMARTLSTASEYQHYVWELSGTGVLEFRPMTGSAFTPRYWYIAKPRRLRYDQAEIVYSSITGVHSFLKSEAKRKLYLGVNEFLNAQGWAGEADRERENVRSALLQETWSKNTRIVPHLF